MGEWPWPEVVVHIARKTIGIPMVLLLGERSLTKRTRTRDLNRLVMNLMIFPQTIGLETKHGDRYGLGARCKCSNVQIMHQIMSSWPYTNVIKYIYDKTYRCWLWVLGSGRWQFPMKTNVIQRRPRDCCGPGRLAGHGAFDLHELLYLPKHTQMLKDRGAR